MPYPYERFLKPGWRALRGQEYRDAHVAASAAYQAWRAHRKIEIAAERAAKAATQMTCQVCGRGIFAEAGLIAHHGYERPYEGVQTASCGGARQLPFEVSRDWLAEEIALLERLVAAAEKHVAEIEGETAPILVSWEINEKLGETGRGFRSRIEWAKRTVPVTRATFDEVAADRKATQREAHGYFYGGFDGIKRTAKIKAEGRLRSLTADLTTQRERYLGWKQTHRAGAAGEPTWVAL